MPALLINIKIDDQVKYDLFTVTLSDLREHFSECHIKFRGSYSQKCLDYAKQILTNVASLTFYQNLQEEDWVDATTKMVENVTSRSLFLYCEDHKLVSTEEHLTSVLINFDRHELDCLCYSFFAASALGVENLLPLKPEQTDQFHIIQYSKDTNELLGKISPRYCSSSLVSIYSVKYFTSLLSVANTKYKIHSRRLHATLARLLPHPRYRKWYHRINQRLAPLRVTLCIEPPSSPFNLEHIWFETVFYETPWRVGILVSELFANYDDDNGAYKESLIKRGLYPFELAKPSPTGAAHTDYIEVPIALANGELFDCTYFSRAGRIRNPPLLRIRVVSGRASLACKTVEHTLEEGADICVYANQKALLRGLGSAVIALRVYDEVF